MRVQVRLFLCTCVLLAGTLSWAHEIETHITLTTTAVQYLAQEDSRFAPMVNTLTESLVIGAEHEDDFISLRRHGRFFFHFLPALDDNPSGPVPTVSATCDAIQWGFGNETCTASISGLRDVDIQNEFTYGNAVQHANSSQGLIDLGYVLHLLEDMGVPSHTRNDAHPPTNRDLYEKINVGRPILAPEGGLFEGSTAENFLHELQRFTATHFFSRDTVFNPEPPVSTQDNQDYFSDSEGRRLAYKGALYRKTRNPEDAEIDEVIVREQFDELAPLIVRYVASFIKFYFEETNQLPEPEPSTKFVIGDRVQINTGDGSNLNVRSTPNGSIVGQQPDGAQSTVIGGPVFAGGLWWWEVDFGTREDGWAAEDFLDLQSQFPGGGQFYLSFLEGDPAVEGDGIIINSADADNPDTFQVEPPFPLAGVTDGISVTFFTGTQLPDTTTYCLSLFFSLTRDPRFGPSSTVICQVQHLNVDGSPGVRAVFTQSMLQSQLELFIQRFYPDATMNELLIESVELLPIEHTIRWTEADAVLVEIHGSLE